MPNYCSNTVYITGPKESIKAIAKRIENRKEDAGIFSLFNPLPEQLSGIVSGSCTIDDKRCDCFRHVHKETGVRLYEYGYTTFTDSDGNEYDRKDAINQAVDAQEQRELMNAYGAINWYEWQSSNWGTKWDVSDFKYEATEEKIALRFDTAWAPAAGFWTKFSEKNPELTVDNHFAEQGMEYAGTTRHVQGDASDTYEFSGSFFDRSGIDENDDEAMDAFWEDPCLTPELGQFVEAHGLGLGG
jgi:hypothetical protein